MVPTPCWWNTREPKEAHLANTWGVVTPAVRFSSRKKTKANNMAVQGEVGSDFAPLRKAPGRPDHHVVTFSSPRSDSDLDPPWTLNSLVFTRIKRVLTAHFELFVLECYKENCLL